MVVVKHSMGLRHWRSGYYEDIATRNLHRVRSENWLWIWVEEGALEGTIAGIPFTAEPGELVCFPPGLSHSYGPGEAQHWKWLWVHFDGVSADALMAELKIFPSAPTLKVGVGGPASLKFFDMLAASHRDETASVREVDIRLMAFITAVIDQASTPQSFESVTRSDFIEWIHSHLSGDSAIAQAAKRFGYSDVGFAAAFHERTGVKPGIYIEGARVSLASWLLAETSANITEISAEAGFASVDEFREAFVRTQSLSPEEYRRQAAM